MEENQISNDQEKKIETISFNPIKIEFNSVKYELNIEAKENMITFTIDDKDILTTIKYTRTMDFKEIRDLSNVFYELNSPNEFYGYIRSLSDNKQLILKKDKDKISIILILEVSSTKQIINIDLFPVKKNENIIKNDIWEKLLEIKEKNKEIEIIKKESKALREDISTLKKENIEFKNLISLLMKENKELKKELIDLKNQEQEKIKERDFSECLDEEIKEKKIMKRQQDEKLYVKAFDSKNDEDGYLINNKQIVMQSKKRRTIFQNMKRLGDILLDKKKSQINDTETLNSNTYIIKPFDSKTFSTNNAGRTKTNMRSQTKILDLGLDEMASKGSLSRDSLFKRRNLLGGRGGVVNFAWKKYERKNKFSIRKSRAIGRGSNHINLYEREKAAKIIQEWWGERKLKYKKRLNQIIKIQSVFRGKFIRNYVKDVYFLMFLYQKFIDIMNKTLVNHIRPKVFDELFPRKKLLK